MADQSLEKHEDSKDNVEGASGSKPTASSGAESPRTAREPDFDDETHDTTLAVPEKRSPPQKRVSFQEDDEVVPPPKPPRPMSAQAHAESTLIEAFPSMDAKVVKAVLVASGGKVEPAFNALLSMSDPDFVNDVPPPPPPRRTLAERQMEADEIYARQLAAHYDSSGRTSTYSGYGARDHGNPPVPPRKGETGLKPNELYDKDHSFFEDDLPIIRQNIQKGFQETQTKVTRWISDFKKRLDGEEDEEEGPSHQPPRRQDYGPSQSDQLHGIRKNAEAPRRSGERDRYDADPQVISDDFGRRLELRDDEEVAPKRPPRPLANPDLFKPTPTTAERSTTDDSLYRQASPVGIRQPSPAGGKQGNTKWQPLSSLEPKAEADDHDPFSLGDSDEELEGKKDSKPESKDQETKGKVESTGNSKPTETISETKVGDGKTTE